MYNKIKSGQLMTKIFALSSGKVGKFEYLTGE